MLSKVPHGPSEMTEESSSNATQTWNNMGHLSGQQRPPNAPTHCFHRKPSTADTCQLPATVFEPPCATFLHFLGRPHTPASVLLRKSPLTACGHLFPLLVSTSESRVNTTDWRGPAHGPASQLQRRLGNWVSSLPAAAGHR